MCFLFLSGIVVSVGIGIELLKWKLVWFFSVMLWMVRLLNVLFESCWCVMLVVLCSVLYSDVFCCVFSVLCVIMFMVVGILCNVMLWNVLIFVVLVVKFCWLFVVMVVLFKLIVVVFVWGWFFLVWVNVEMVRGMVVSVQENVWVVRRWFIVDKGMIRSGKIRCVIMQLCVGDEKMCCKILCGVLICWLVGGNLLVCLVEVMVSGQVSCLLLFIK